MTPDLFVALLGFSFVTSITPGPNNLMLLASGANFGFLPTVPHMLGISVGFCVMTLLMGLGLAGLFLTLPWLKGVLKVLAVLYMLWLAWKIAHAGAPAEGRANGARPMTFLQAAAFQWVNPKAWAMALGAIAAYAGGGEIGVLVLVAVTFATVNLPSISVWAYAGDRLRLALSNPDRLRAFNWTMAVLLVLSLIPVLRL